jgi:hypothetical protein
VTILYNRPQQVKPIAFIFSDNYILELRVISKAMSENNFFEGHYKLEHLYKPSKRKLTKIDLTNKETITIDWLNRLAHKEDTTVIF